LAASSKVVVAVRDSHERKTAAGSQFTLQWMDGWMDEWWMMSDDARVNNKGNRNTPEIIESEEK